MLTVRPHVGVCRSICRNPHHVVKASLRNGSPSIRLKNGVPLDGPDLSVTSNGQRFPNPFIIGSGPPGTNYAVMKRALDEGWGGVICKTLVLDDNSITNVNPRYAQWRHEGTIMGWENIELVSDRPFLTMLEELKRLREEYPDRKIIASIMEKHDRASWEEIVDRVEATGVDGFEVNFSCPHGLPESGMGSAMGQVPELVKEVSQWITQKTDLPVWGKMTPNITDITRPAKAALEGGCAGITAINTISSVMGIDLETLRPQPTVEGYSTPGGYSYKAVKPIALAHVQKCAKLIQDEFQGDRSLSGLGGIETGSDAAEFILLGSDTVQSCTGVMIHGYGFIKTLCAGLQDFMKKHNFESVEEFKGAALPYFTTHADLVERQRKANEIKKAKKFVTDADWSAEEFTNEVQSMVSN